MIKNHLLYQLSYAGGSEGPRHVFTILPSASASVGRRDGWHARQDSNLQPSGSKPDALSG